ncbi:MAG TPA: FAD-dependent oxidoreductase [Chloroflexota bacterium]|nr:FAD-dependent oxidoreductase [Chloroflexota bacterium]
MSGNGSTGPRVVIVGGSFAGLAAAYAAREHLRPDGRVTVIAATGRFIFAPSLIWTAFDKPVPHTSFNLDAALGAKGIEFVRAPVDAIRTDQQLVVTEQAEIPYDRLVIATGGVPNAAAIPGLAGELRRATWIVGEDSARDARAMLHRIFEHPGPLVVGAAQGASYISAAYELALNLDNELRRRGQRERVPITFVTGERALGDLRIGQTAAHHALERLFEERDIAFHAGAGIRRVEQGVIRLTDGRILEAAGAIIMPPFSGSVNIWHSAGLTDATGLVPVTAEYRHASFPEVYAAGVAAYFEQPVPPLNQWPAPHTGYLSLHMGRVAGTNVAASLGSGTPAEHPLPYVVDTRVLDGGDVGLLITSTGREELRHTAAEVPGQVAHYFKAASDRYLSWQLRNGRLIPA